MQTVIICLSRNVRKAIEDKLTDIEAYVVKDGGLKSFTLKMGDLTDDERTRLF